MFELFKKRKLIQQSSQEMKELELEFDQEKRRMAMMASSELYKLFKDYFEAKIEINRDRMELIDGVKAEQLKVENKVMREFINDIESMKQLAEIDDKYLV